MARSSHRVDSLSQGSAARLALSPDSDGVLRVKGCVELTACNGEQFRRQTNAALNGHTSIEIDLSDTIVMDCSGLGALIALRNCARRRNGVVRLMSPIPAVRRLLEIVRAEQMFEIVHTVGLDPMARSQPRFSVPMVTQPKRQEYASGKETWAGSSPPSSAWD
jgi:anti-anti-sigma factor